ncbi:MAG: 30S ribosomal protein S16 [Xanthomonadaceae bacterium]|jgi:small subunit ribosomal protein S16|nr:30S ribosomal protein S16 [Xanthomonadaceae bacterium]
MVKIRLSRGGAKGRPFYHIVVADERYARDGRSIERLGFYNPIAAGKDVKLQLDTAKAAEWIKKGAQPTEKVRQLIKQASKQAAA